MDQAPAAAVSRQEHQEEMVGTWLAIAMIADQLIEAGLIERQSILTTLADAERSCPAIEGRRRAIRAVCRSIAMLSGENPGNLPACSPRRKTKTVRPRGKTSVIAAAE